MIRNLALLAVSISAWAQPASPPQFEVASIKPSNAEPGSSGIDSEHGRIAAHNVTLKRCIMGAYQIGPNQIFGGPDWLDSARFEIIAKTDQNVGDGVLMLMLQTLLADRFKLAVHREAKPIQVYVLEVAKNGPKLEKGDGTGAKTESRRGRIEAANSTMDRFAEVVSRQVDLPVVNHTGLEGAFNFKLQWAPPNAKDSDGPSIFTALQEQLGLRLRSQKTPVEVLVIDHAELPTEN
jgi:uncharacterized protein (TIGR03435 family)